MNKKFDSLPLRSGVGIIVLNKDNKIFVAKRIDNPKDFWVWTNKNLSHKESIITLATPLEFSP